MRSGEAERPAGSGGERSWWAAGLRFECTRCGVCCCGPEPGYVWVSPLEVERLSEFLGLTIDEFGSRYLRRVGDCLSLVEKPVSLDCVFWDDQKGCLVYEARPKQCRAYPFWDEVLESAETWSEEGESCPGIGKGRRHDGSRIAAALASGGHPPMEV